MTSRTLRLSATVAVAAIAMNLIIALPAAAQTDTNTRLVFEIKNTTITIPTLDDLFSQPQQPAESQTPPVDPNIAVLQDYLNAKGSPLAPYAADILQYENWKLVLAISNGESTMCKHELYNNCWGVGGAWNLKRYDSFSAGFADVDQLLGNKYIPLGADTPQEIVRKYVGAYSASWVAAVNQVLSQLDQLPLVN